jgi:polysaccharide pyruvyl transferase WcaK-like protein
MNKKKIIITGYHGANNLGDDLTLYVFFKYMQKMSPETEIVLLIPQSYSSKDIVVPPGCKVSIDTFYSKNKIKNLFKLIRLRKSADILIWLGGTYFSDDEGLNLFKIPLFVAWIIGIKIGFISIGIGRLNNIFNKIQTKILLSLASITTFRDKHSYNLASKMCKNKKFYLTADLAYLYLNDMRKMNIKKRAKEKAMNILISWRNYGNYVNDNDCCRLIEGLICSLGKLQKTANIKSIKLLPLDNRIDEDIHSLIEQRLRSIFPQTDVNNYSHLKRFDDKVDIIKKADLYICGRLHGCFVGWFSGVLTVALNYSPKVKYFLEDVGFGGMVNFDELIANNELLANKVLRLLSANIELDTINIDRRIFMATENIELLCKYLNG